MGILKIDPMEYPLSIGESWWIIHPNSNEGEIRIPVGAPAVCTQNFNDFVKNSPYRIVAVDDHNGWVSIELKPQYIVEMPRYIFARYFDAVAYIMRMNEIESKDE